MELIDKAAVVAEIERRWRSLANKNLKSNGKYDIEISTLLSIKNFIDSLEVKEVDFETALAASIDHFDEKNDYGKWSEYDLEDFAKHFFELGIKAAQKGE